MSSESLVGFIGGTGPEGLGLGLRFSLNGIKVVIGSRSIEKAELAVSKIQSKIPDGYISVGLNKEVAEKCDPVFIAVPYQAQKSTLEELKDITEVAHEAGLRVHMDGARIANAAVSLGCDIAKFTADIGIDILSFGGTKNGMVYGEAIIVFDPELSEAVEYLQKQSAQLPSKMRFIAAQFLAMLQNDRWLDYARHANNMAALLAEKVSAISGVTITQPTQANAVFATLPNEVISELQEWSPFYTWEGENEVRWMTSFSTQAADVETFALGVKAALGE